MQYDLTDPNVVAGFRGEYRFLSNFYTGIDPIRDDFQGTEIWYPTSEHGYQAEKTLRLEEKLWIARQPTPVDAKRAGRRVKLRPGWHEGKDTHSMEKWISLKFKQEVMRARLIATGEKILVEVNTHGDRYWGTDRSGLGDNRLGVLLMNYRDNVLASM